MTKRPEWLVPVLAGAMLAFLGCGGDDDGGDDDDTPAIDAAAGQPDAPPGAPDAMPGTPDAMPGAPDAGPGGVPSFLRHAVDEAAGGAAYATVADVDDDGELDLVVASFGKMAGFEVPKGTVKIYRRTGAGASLADWSAETVIDTSDGVIFPNQPTVEDVDGDGDLDIFVPAGFLVCSITFIPGNGPCGELAWWEQTGSGWVKHTLLEKQALFYHHVVLVDLDGDGVRDLVTVGEEQAFLGMGQNRAEAIWLKGTAGGDRFQTTKQVIGAGLGSFPRLHDLDGDGDLDVASAEYFAGTGSFAWYENGGNGASWTRHVIDDDSGPAIMLTLVDDMTGDGKLRAIGANHTNTAKMPPDPQPSEVYLLTPPADPRQPWSKQAISSGIVSLPGSQMAPQAAPGIFGIGDIDGDGDRDVLVSGDGDPNVYWLEQTAPGTFTTRMLEMGLEQAGGMLVRDLNGDGRAELVVTGYIDDKIYVYERDADGE